MARTRGRIQLRDDGRALVAVAVGGAIGAVARYAVDTAADRWGIAPTWATLLVNALGCALMGLLVAYVLAHPGRHLLWRPFLGAGVLGGFTTFSAFAGDAVLLTDEGAWAASAAYIVATLVCGFVALWGGTRLGSVLRRRRPVA
jgi:CrcB protein